MIGHGRGFGIFFQIGVGTDKVIVVWQRGDIVTVGQRDERRLTDQAQASTKVHCKQSISAGMAATIRQSLENRKNLMK